MKFWCKKCKKTVYGDKCPDCYSGMGKGSMLDEEKSFDGPCEMCGSRGRLVAGRYVFSNRDKYLCFDCYHSFNRRKGFTFSSAAKYSAEEIKSQREWLMKKYYGDDHG
jgi:hypothetical protein